MEPRSSRDLSGPKPRKDKQRETRNAVAKTPDKTKDWDRNKVHEDGDSIGIEEDEAWPVATAAVISKAAARQGWRGRTSHAGPDQQGSQRSG